MNRREAIAALTALPGLTRISRADVKPSDVIVVEIDQPISMDASEHIKAHLGQIWPNNRIAVCGDGMRIKVLSEAEPKG